MCLLGADLEHAAGTTEGWKAIIGSGERPTGRAGFFKVPHHGSENADVPIDRQLRLMTAQPLLRSLRLPAQALHRQPELRRVVRDREMNRLVRDEVAQYEVRREDEPPVEREVSRASSCPTWCADPSRRPGGAVCRRRAVMTERCFSISVRACFRSQFSRLRADWRSCDPARLHHDFAIDEVHTSPSRQRRLDAHLRRFPTKENLASPTLRGPPHAA